MKVGIPSVLERYTGGTREVEASGTTLTEMIKDLDERYPGIRFRMVNERGALRPHVRIFVNGTIAHKLTVPVCDTDEIVILQALSGG
jgi:molybdopterin converting factor small subunit